jgi:hypothetical protein
MQTPSRSSATDNWCALPSKTKRSLEVALMLKIVTNYAIYHLRPGVRLPIDGMELENLKREVEPWSLNLVRSPASDQRGCCSTAKPNGRQNLPPQEQPHGSCADGWERRAVDVARGLLHRE